MDKMNEKKVVIFGAWNTGTNLISNILNNNIFIDLKTNQELTVCNNNKVWKHHPKYALIEELVKDPNNLIIIMYRNVFSWLNSMNKSSYEAKFESMNSIVKIQNKHENVDVSFRNIVHVYNHYYNNYMKLSIQYPNVVFFDYRKIINQETSFEYMNFKFSKVNLTMKTKYKVIQQLIQPAKKHGKPVNDAREAIQKYGITIFKMKNEIKQNNMEHFIDKNIIDYFENDYV